MKKSALLFAMLLGACSDILGGNRIVMVDTQFEEYSPGQAVQVTIRNTGADELTYGACGSSIERLVGGRWVPAAAAELCAAPGFILPSGEAHLVYARGLPRDLQTGLYRLEVAVLRNAELLPRSQRKTSAFRVTSGCGVITLDGVILHDVLPARRCP